MILLSKNLMIKMAFPTRSVFVVGSWNVLPNSDLGQLVICLSHGHFECRKCVDRS